MFEKYTGVKFALCVGVWVGRGAGTDVGVGVENVLESAIGKGLLELRATLMEMETMMF